MNDNVLPTRLRQALAVLPDLLPRQRWFMHKMQRIAGVELRDWLAVPLPEGVGALALVDVRFAEGAKLAAYFMPLVLGRHDGNALADSAALDGALALRDGLADRDFCLALLREVDAGETRRGQCGSFRFVRFGPQPHLDLEPHVVRGEQSNTSVRFGDAYMLKAFRRLAPGVNPDREIGSFLTLRSFANVPALAAYLEYEGDDGWSADLAVMQCFVANEGDAWTHTFSVLRGFYDQVLKSSADAGTAPADKQVEHSCAAHLREANRLGRLTASLHNALADDLSDPDFRPEPMTESDIATWTRASSARLASTIQALDADRDRYPDEVAIHVSALAARVADYRTAVEEFSGLPLAGVHRIRLHGDYHLGQVILAQGDFVILDFEGEPLRPLAERRAKQLAAKDVAGMLRSYHYAASAALLERDASVRRYLRPWADAWLRLMRAAFLAGYFAQAGSTSFWPPDRRVAEQLIAIFELDKACYELAYEAASRPDWLAVPLSYLSSL